MTENLDRKDAARFITLFRKLHPLKSSVLPVAHPSLPLDQPKAHNTKAASPDPHLSRGDNVDSPLEKD